jgi:hypothetical protein
LVAAGNVIRSGEASSLRLRSPPELADDRAARGVRERMEDPVEPRRTI